VDTEAGSVDGGLKVEGLANQVSYRFDRTYSVTTDDLSFHVNMDHVADFHKTEVASKTGYLTQYLSAYDSEWNHSRINPEGVRVDWVTNTDVTCGSFEIALSGHHPEGSGYAFQCPLSLVVWIGESWDTFHRGSSAYSRAGPIDA
jgi:hypothetical protein